MRWYRNVPNSFESEYYAQRAAVGLSSPRDRRLQQGDDPKPSANAISQDRTVGKRRHEALYPEAGRTSRLFIMAVISFFAHLNGGPPVAPSAIPKLPDSRAMAGRFRLRQFPELSNRTTTNESRYSTEQRTPSRQASDGVELQASNSHLIDQFLEDEQNIRTDAATKFRHQSDAVPSRNYSGSLSYHRGRTTQSTFHLFNSARIDSNLMRLFTSDHELKLIWEPGIPPPPPRVGDWSGDVLHEDALNNAKLPFL